MKHKDNKVNNLFGGRRRERERGKERERERGGRKTQTVVGQLVIIKRALSKRKLIVER